MWSVLNRKKKIVNRSLRTFTVLPVFSVYLTTPETRGWTTPETRGLDQPKTRVSTSPKTRVSTSPKPGSRPAQNQGSRPAQNQGGYYPLLRAFTTLPATVPTLPILRLPVEMQSRAGRDAKLSSRGRDAKLNWERCKAQLLVEMHG